MHPLSVWPLTDSTAKILHETEGPHRVRRRLNPDLTFCDRYVKKDETSKYWDIKPASVVSSELEDPPALPKNLRKSIRRDVTASPARSQTGGAVRLDIDRFLWRFEENEQFVDAFNCSRLLGNDRCDGVLILSSFHIFVFDNMRIEDDGEVRLLESHPTNWSSFEVLRRSYSEVRVLVQL